MLGGLGGAANKERGEEMLNKFKEALQTDFAQIRRLRNDSNKDKGRETFTVNEKDSEKFNQLIKKFLEDFKNGAKKKDCLNSISAMDIFTRQNNGSKYFEKTS